MTGHLPELSAYINSSNGNITQTFVYANAVTGGWFVPFMVLGFFMTTLIGSYIGQMRFSTKPRFELSLIASSFVTFLFALILEQKTGVLNPVYYFVIVGIFIMSVLYLFFNKEQE